MKRLAAFATLAALLACDPSTGALVVPPIAHEPTPPAPPPEPVGPPPPTDCCVPKPPPPRVVGPSLRDYLDGGGQVVGIEYLAALTYAGADPVAVVDDVADAGGNWLRVFTVLARRPPEVPAYPGWIVSAWAHEEAWRARLVAMLDRAAERGVFVSLCLFDRVDRGYVGGGGFLYDDLDVARADGFRRVTWSADVPDAWGAIGNLSGDLVTSRIEPYAAGTWGPWPVPDGWPEVVEYYLRGLTPEAYPHLLIEVENEPHIAAPGGQGFSGLPNSAVASELQARGWPVGRTVDYYDLGAYPGADMVREHHWALRDLWPDDALERAAVLEEANPGKAIMVSTDGAGWDRPDGLDVEAEARMFSSRGWSYAALVIRPESVGPAMAEAARGWGR